MTLQNLKRKILPSEEVPGLAVSDNSLRLLLIARENLRVIFKVETELPHGAVVGGELKKPAEFLAAISKLKSMAGPQFARHPVVILSLPSVLFYLRMIELPEMAESGYEEAARLNATQLSPIKLDEGYFDWQNLGVDLRTLQREILIAVGNKSKIDPYLEILRRANIDVIAVEPDSLSLLRTINYFLLEAEKNAPYFIVSVGREGMQFLISKEGKIFLDRFLSWQEVEGVKDYKIYRRDFEKILKREVAKLMNFYVSHRQEEVSNAILIIPFLYSDMAQLLRQSYRLKVVPLKLPPPFGQERNAVLWAPAIGAALRGIIPRAEDSIVSLMPVGTEALYSQHRLYSFISLWSKIASGTILGTLLMYGILAAIVFRVAHSVQNTQLALERSANVQESKRLESEAAEFNRLVRDILAAQKYSSRWSEKLEPLVRAIESERPGVVAIRKMTFAQDSSVINIKAFASSLEASNSFKEKLEKSGNFKSVERPIGSVTNVPGGVAFDLIIQLKP